MIEYLSLFIIALLLTIAVESIVAFLFKLNTAKDIRTVILINVITNPLLNYLLVLNYNYRVIENDTLLIVGLETAVVIAEWLMLTQFLRRPSKNMFVVSVTMNACSYLVGLLVM